MAEVWVVRQLRDTAARHPNRAAVCEASQSVGFGELVAQASLVCDGLRSEGIGPEDVVAVTMPRSTSAIVAILGIWMTGAVYLPVDPRWPTHRRELVLRSSAAVAALEVGTQGCRPLGASGVLLRRLRRILPMPGVSREPEVSGRNLAYVLFTSGSTGAPNAVGVEFDALDNYSRYLQGLVADLDVFGDSSVRVMLATNLSFDASLRPVLLLVGGSTLVIAPDLADGSWQEQIDCVTANRVEILSGSPTWFSGLLSAGFAPGEAGVRLAFVGGEPVPNGLVARLREDNCEVVVQYGPTETTIAAFGAVLAGADYSEPPIGDPIPGTRVFLRAVDNASDGHGEDRFTLEVGGAGVARGYLGNPRLTAERFVPDPGGPPGARRFRTGDLVRTRVVGGYRFVGRDDDQIKIGGQRIELGEVRSVLDQHPSVAQSAVLVVDGGNHPRLVACYVARSGAEAGLDAVLRDRVATELPGAMVPTVIREVDALPLTHHGKVDRTALADMFAVSDSLGLEEGGQIDDTERRLFGLVGGALGVACTIDDDFFALGGGSLDALRLLACVHDEFGVRVSLRDFHRDASVRALRTLIGAAR